MARKRGFTITNHDALIDCAEKLTHSRGFSNARTMRNLLDHSIIEAASSHDEPTIGERDLKVALNEVFDGSGLRTVGF